MWNEQLWISAMVCCPLRLEEIAQLYRVDMVMYVNIPHDRVPVPESAVKLHIGLPS